ncbi:MAG: SAM-dependent methyltransferase [Opitutus sp.]|nr:SAM-dependent methyltransferase [Opitutus sp.]MCS6247934.1 SAM-dependent methyltransferase [Opitutus sp.]MCS6274381.1 SAM-dependent methyltransferase [Opitutus sp.]MCS6277206.1 SAM-dependent methyltransferase [Opitutus sp.]MCS6300328.1 SAM-dependent methyltransferase [Opitutus sp.]
MGSSATTSPAFAAAFLARSGPDGVLSFADFMELALYHPQLGYYRQDRTRVGYAPGTDFYTASSSGPVFGEMVAAACVALLGGEARAREHAFVEIGAEAGAGVLAGVAHPFASARTVRVGEAQQLAGPCVVFSNELFDAQPLRRFIRRGETWRELGVQLRGDQLHEIELAETNASWLPPDASEGNVFDAPRAAAELATAIAAQPWTGLFVAFDYGKSFAELATATPAGTARAYFQHTQSNELLARAGEQDLTGHVCWDWLQAALDTAGCTGSRVESQEAFFIHHAGAFLAHAMAAEATRVSPRKLALLQLLHPSHLGQKFQVLHARR